MTSPFMSVHDLVDLRASALDDSSSDVQVLDASYLLHPAKFDGDYRRESGRPRWVDAHIPHSQHVDVPTQFSDTTAFSGTAAFSGSAEQAVHYLHPVPQAIADELAALGIGSAAPVVVYDTTGGLFAARLWYLLTWIGVDARVLDGGLAAWIAAGEPTMSGEEEGPKAVPTWSATSTRDAWVTKAELVERAANDSRPLVCGLPAGSFTGADPTRYSRRGHIPGSVNVSARDLFAADGTVKHDDDLRAAYESQGVTGNDEVLLYCGGGISAAANALTLAELGVSPVRIYDGSLEEWSADPTLPLALS